MSQQKDKPSNYNTENKEWVQSLRWIIENESGERVAELLNLLTMEAQKHGIAPDLNLHTSYINTISPEEEEPYPGDLDIEKKLMAFIRWNAMAMVARANREKPGIGGHISTYASIADLWEVGFHHFFKVYENGKRDIIYFQGHASPGIYSRAFLEGRLDEENLKNFRREVKSDKGITSYPHPRLMPQFWNFPTVSMGLAPLMAIYQARFNRHLVQKDLVDKDDQMVWAFVGDGEMDETEARGALNVAARNRLDNLIFVVDCNLQRLDGPVRGNRKIIQELEGVFKGAGWNVIKLIWGKEWDSLIADDKDNKLVRKLTDLPDGQLQKYAFSDGEYMKEDLFESDPALEKLVKNISGSELKNMHRGGHDPVKIYNAYRQAVDHTGGPTVILAQTIKGYGQGDEGEASNVAHQTKKMSIDGMKHFRDFFGVPLSDDQLEEIPFIKPGEDSAEMEYLLERRKKLGGYIPVREDRSPQFSSLDNEIFGDFMEGSEDKEVATTMVVVKILGRLLKDEEAGKYIVPVIPDESRTFGMEALFQQSGIYAPEGQQYDPVDEDSLLYYRETEDGAIMEEGITEAGCASEFIAAGTAYLTHGLPMIPFYFFYSMFGFQRTADLFWAAADAGAKGFLIGGISGRTSIAGEGLQHQDGQSHLYALAFPNVRAYDPAFAYEIAVIIESGIEEMFNEKKNEFYYITVGNPTFPMPAMPENSREGILRGMYRFKSSARKNDGHKVHLFGSGAIMQEVLAAADKLEDDYECNVDVWSVTSYKALYDNAIDTARENRLRAQLNKNPNYIQECLSGEEGVFVAASDFVKALPESIGRWIPGPFTALGTDGFGRSDGNEELRGFFEVDARHIIYAALYELAGNGDIETEVVRQASEDLSINPEKNNPRTS